MSLIEVVGLLQKYGDRVVLNNINVNIDKGEVFALIGPTGAGKTTFLRLIDLLEPHGALVADDVLFPVMALPEGLKRWQEVLAQYNQALRDHPALQTVWLPIGDGVAVSVKLSR